MNNNSPHRGPPEACHGARSGRHARRRNGFMIVTAVAVLALALGIAIDRQWLSLGAFTPLLLALPCATMIFICMRGMNHGAADASNPLPRDPANTTVPGDS